MPNLDPDLVEALVSARRIVTADPRDWTANRHDAFLYGLFRGWDDSQVGQEVADRHGWNEEFVARLHRLQTAVHNAIE